MGYSMDGQDRVTRCDLVQEIFPCVILWKHVILYKLVGASFFTWLPSDTSKMASTVGMATATYLSNMVIVT